MTQRLERPVLSPRILGPMMLPSTCCSAKTKRVKYTAFRGLSSRMRKMLGMAPRKGPKKGITLVTPTMTLTRGVYGKFRREQPMKQMRPMMRESRILPRTKPEKISSTRPTARKTQGVCRGAVRA